MLEHFYENWVNRCWGNLGQYLVLLLCYNLNFDTNDTLLELDIKHNRIKKNKDGDYIVALRFRPGIDLVLTILALIKAGLAYVPIAPNWPDGRIKLLLEDCQPIWAITNIKADPLYKAISNMDTEDLFTPKIFQVRSTSSKT